MPRKKSVKNSSSITRNALGIASGVVILAGSLAVAKHVIDPYEFVTDVIDGDTFTINNKQTVRLYRVNAPEIEYCFGDEAKKALGNKILGRKVILKSPRTDYFKRVQAYVYVEDEFVNEFIALNGYGAGRESGENEEDKIIAKANEYAKSNKIGIYSEKCYPSKPPSPNCQIKGNAVYDSSEKVYRLPGCRDYSKTIIERFRGDDYFCSEAEAVKAGFTKAKTCLN